MAHIDDFTGVYGPRWVRGVLVDDLAGAEAAGLRVIATALAVWVYDGTRPAVRVVCGDLVEVDTEDGPMTGRCGVPILPDAGACEHHAAERDAWLAMSEPEKAAWERDRELFDA